MPTKPNILLVDDDTAHRSMLRTMLRSWGYTVSEADDGDVAVELVRQQPFDAVLTDVRMARMDGITAVREIIAYNPAIPIILMTAYSSVETAVEALRLGAYDYLTKPLDFDVLQHTLHRAVEHTRLAEENADLRRKLGGSGTGTLLGRSQAMAELVSMIETVGPSEATVLIHGESGTGKELVARAICTTSTRSGKPFVAVNCAALSESLLESELFGHEKGSFTGADKRREGRFMQANGGTLFLDEIGELPLSLQATFLRALQQGEVQRVGSDQPDVVDVRIIAATNKDLRTAVAAGNFREDLFYRLNVITIEMPPLRTRKEDIPLLATAFLERFSAVNRKTVKGFTPQAMDALLRYDWPGNVRELENTIERAVILCAAEHISGREFPDTLSAMAGESMLKEQPGLTRDSGFSEGPQDSEFLSQPLEDLEKKAILHTLSLCGDNKSEAARRLGITRATLHNKLKKYGME